MSTVHKIEQWHSVLLGSKTFGKPFVFIKGSRELDKLMNRNVIVVVEGTNTKYDNKAATGFLSSSAYLPEFRPFFFDKTQYYTVILNMNWMGYPIKEGVIHIFDPKYVNLPSPKISTPEPLPWPSGTNTVVLPQKPNLPY